MPRGLGIVTSTENPVTEYRNCKKYLDAIEADIRDVGEQKKTDRKDLPAKVKGVIKVLDDIGDELRPLHSRQGKLPRAQLPEEVKEIVQVLGDIECVLLNPREKSLGRSEFAGRVQQAHQIVRGIDTQLSRTVNKPLPNDVIVDHTKAIVDSLEAIEQSIRPKYQAKLYFTALQPRIEDILRESSGRYEILVCISAIIDPSKTVSGNFGHLPLEVKNLIQNQVSDHKAVRQEANTTISYARARETTENEETAESLARDVSRLEKEVRKLRRRNEELEIAALENVKSLRDAEQHVNTLKTERAAEVQHLDQTIVNLKEIHTKSMSRLIGKHESAVEDVQTTHKQEITQMIAERDDHVRQLRTTHQQISNLRKDHSKELKEEKSKFEKKAQEIMLQHTADINLQAQNHSLEKKRIQSQHKKEKEELQNRNRGLSATQQAELKQVQENAEKTAKDIEIRWIQKLSEGEQEHKAAYDDARKRVKQLESQCERLESQDQLHASELKDQAKRFSDLEEDKRLQLAAQQRQHEAELKNEMKRVAEAEREWKLKMAEVEESHQIEAREWEQVFDKEKTRIAEQLNEKNQEHMAALEKLDQRWQRNLDAIKRDKERLQDLLLKKDNFDGLTDLQIIQGVTSKDEGVPIIGFGTMASKITSFAEWEWREDRKVWPNDVMVALTGTKQRRLKKLILGDVIWTTLYRLIFCSPFRILGEEGKREEKNWNKQFQSDVEENSYYTWPTPTSISEKYRYDTCQGALEALTQRASPYTKLRTSFQKNQGPFHEQFFDTIGAYVDLPQKREGDLGKFLTEVVRLWLVFCTQRYRIRMLLTGSSESDPEKKMKLAQEDQSLAFTIVPRLQRHGNPQGAQLQEVSVISGCDGKAATAYE